MDNDSMDPYEAQLYEVFTKFADSYGSLHHSSLTELCADLQMEKSATDELVALARKSGKRLSFSRFRDNLVEVLGGDPASTASNIGNSDEESSGKELSPKYVYGSKKYGRRSRPRDLTNKMNLAMEKSARVQKQAKVKQELSELELSPQLDHKTELLEDPDTKTKQHLGAALEIELEHNKTVDCNEAMVLCRSMQMVNIDNDLIQNLFEEEDLTSGGRLTVGEFFHRLNKKLITSITVESDETTLLTCKNKNGRRDANSWVDRELVVDMWERAGITHCRQMLHDLGYTGDKLHLAQLSSSLDSEIKSLLGDVNKTSGTNIPSLLLQASLSLHRYELRCIKDTMDQVFAENSKMKTDLNEANTRAQLLAQEVDENHAKMEASLRKKIQQLESTHLDTNREMEEQKLLERENSIIEIQQLRDKLSAIEAEDTKLRCRCSALENTNEELERRITRSDELIQELEEVRIQLTREVKALRTERNEYNDPIRELSEIEKLTTLVSDFRIENKSLRDRNDELCSEIDDLQHKLTRENRRLSLGRSKPQCSVDISSEQAISFLEECEGSWDVRRDGQNAVKRRGDSPSKGQFPLFDDESPRIGKLRRCDIAETDDGRQKDNTSEWDADSGSESTSLQVHLGTEFTRHKLNEDQYRRRKPMIVFDFNLRNVIEQTIMKLNENKMESCESCDTLKGILSMIHECTEGVDNMKYTSNYTTLATKTTVEIQTEPIEILNKEENCENYKLGEEKEKLTNMVRVLESSLEQLKSEYDKCEEYWANKLDEEREIFNEEQRISDEKFQDLLVKISEYEEQFAPTQKNISKLSTIDEKYSLELQFTELEEEFELYRKQKASEIDNKSKEISVLKEQIKQLKNVNSLSPNFNQSQTDSKDEIDGSLRKENFPIDYLWTQGTIQVPIVKSDKKDCTRDYQNPAFSKSSVYDENSEEHARSSSDNEKEKELAAVNPIKKPSGSIKSTNEVFSNIRTGNQSVSQAGHAGSGWSDGGWNDCSQRPSSRGNGMIQCSELEGQLRKNTNTSQSMAAGWTSAGDSTACAVLEQRCRELTLALRQHQVYLESVQQHARSESSVMRQKLYSAETAIATLKQRLTSADILVKELYVENCQLAAFKPQFL